jgi:large subunit ribosomal protein L17
MRHSVYGRKLSRTKNERRRLFAGLVRDLFIRDGITTTLAKAKAVQPIVEKLITKAKVGTEFKRRQVDAVLTNRILTASIFEAAKTRFANRTSGFTRIIKLGKKRGDATDTALLSFVDQKVEVETIQPKEVVKTEKVKAKAAPTTASSKLPKASKSPKKQKLTK